MLTDNKKLYDALESALRTFYTEGEYVHVHAIYEPEGNGGSREEMHDAAADLHEPGLTYHVYFIANDDGSIMIDAVERWYMG